MRSLPRLAAIVAAGVLSCLPLAAQTMVKDSALPAAGTLTGTEGLRAVQGSGCPTSVSPCANVRVTPVQLASYMTSTGQFQASDVDLTAIAALATQGYGRTLLTMPDAPTTRAYLGLGSNALDSTPRAPSVRLINTTAPLTGGGDLSADRTLGISLVNGVTAGAMSAPDKVKLDSVNTGASVSSVTCSGAGGISCSVTSGTTAAQLTIAPGALTPASVAATGTVTGSNLSGTNTGDQTLAGLGGQPLAPNLTALSGLNTAADNCGYWTGSAAAALYSCPGFGRSLLGSTSASVAQATLGLGSAALASTGTSGHAIAFLDGTNTYSGAMTFSQLIAGSISGNAATATKLATARALSVTGDTSWTLNFDGSANATGTSTLATVNAAPGTCGSAVAVPIVTVNAKGLTTGCTTAPLGAAASQTYSEGTFTPVLTFGGSSTGNTYSTQVGRYTRVGRLVTIEINLVMSAKGTATGWANIGGLPFAAATGSIYGGNSFVMPVNVNNVGLIATQMASPTSIGLFNVSGGGYGYLNDTNVASNSAFYITLTYTV